MDLKRLGLIVGGAVSIGMLILSGYIAFTEQINSEIVRSWRFTILATLGAVFMYQYVLIKVSKARTQYNVPVPDMHGPPEFDRVVRAHMNTLENMPLFLPLLWLTALIWGDLWAGIFGWVWVIARFLYAWGYYREAGLRMCGFGISNSVNLLMLLGCLVGWLIG